MKDESKVGAFRFSEVAIIVFITCLFSLFSGISYGKAKYSNTIKVENVSTSNESDSALNNFIKQYKYIISNYYDSKKIDENELLKVALQSILDELGVDDAYSVYMDEEQSL